MVAYGGWERHQEAATIDKGEREIVVVTKGHREAIGVEERGEGGRKLVKCKGRRGPTAVGFGGVA